MRSKYLKAIVACIIPAVIVGYIHNSRLIRKDNLLGCDLYYTYAHRVVRSVDRCTLIMLEAMILVLIAYFLGGLFKRFLRGIPCAIFRITTIALVIVSAFELAVSLRYTLPLKVAVTYYPVRLLHIADLRTLAAAGVVKDFTLNIWNTFTSLSNGNVLQAAFTDDWKLVILAGLVLVTGLGVLLFIHRKQPGEVTEQRDSEPNSSIKLPAWSDMATGRAARAAMSGYGVVAVVFAATFVLLHLATGVLWARNEFTVKSKPNVVLIIVDDLRADHLGCYKYWRNTSPNIDALASQGLLFKDARSSASSTPWSISSMLTSRYPDETVPYPKDLSVIPPMRRKYASIADVLRDRGYATAGVVSNPMLLPKFNYNQGFQIYDTRACNEDISSPDVNLASYGIIRKLKSKRFFLMVHYMDVHVPFYMHRQYNYDPTYKGNVKGPVEPAPNWGLIDVKTPDDVKYAVAAYDSGISYCDKYIGKLMADLKAKGLYDNSLIILTADHGEEFLDHGGFSHGRTLYTEVEHVPLIVKLPHQTQGRIIDGLFSQIDLFPSVLKYLGYSTKGMAFRGKPVDFDFIRSAPDRNVFATIPSRGKQYSVDRYGYQYILTQRTGTEELYDIAKDPYERDDVAKENPKMCAELRAIVKSRLDTVKSSAVLGQGADLTNGERSRFKSLGYLQ